MKSKSAYVLSAALLLPVSALAWNGKSVDPAKQVPPAANAAVEAKAEAKADASGAAKADVQAEAAAKADVQTDAKAQAAGSASGAAQSGVVGAPPAGKGQIVFFRPSKFAGGAVSYKVREGGTELGKLSNGKFFILAVEPGAHEYTVHSEAKDVLNLEVEAGETYYVKGTVSMGVFAGRPNLSPATKGEFDEISAKLKMAK